MGTVLLPLASRIQGMTFWAMKPPRLPTELITASPAAADDRSGGTAEQLAAIPARRLPFVHVCDAPVREGYTTEELLHAARAERLPPGEGGIPLRRILAHMPPGIPVGLEVPMSALAEAAGPEAVARRVRQAAGRLFEETMP